MMITTNNDSKWSLLSDSGDSDRVFTLTSCHWFFVRLKHYFTTSKNFAHLFSAQQRFVHEVKIFAYVDTADN